MLTFAGLGRCRTLPQRPISVTVQGHKPTLLLFPAHLAAVSFYRLFNNVSPNFFSHLPVLFFYQEISDINEHLPTLREYASKCNSVAELGVRLKTSTCAYFKVRRSLRDLHTRWLRCPKTSLGLTIRRRFPLQVASMSLRQVHYIELIILIGLKTLYLNLLESVLVGSVFDFMGRCGEKRNSTRQNLSTWRCELPETIGRLLVSQ